MSRICALREIHTIGIVLPPFPWRYDNRHRQGNKNNNNNNNHTSPLVARGSLLFSSSSISTMAGFSPAQGQSIKKKKKKERKEKIIKKEGITEERCSKLLERTRFRSLSFTNLKWNFTLPFCGPAKAMMSDMAKRIAKTTVAMQRALFCEHTIPLCS